MNWRRTLYFVLIGALAGLFVANLAFYIFGSHQWMSLAVALFELPVIALLVYQLRTYSILRSDAK